MSDSRLGRYTQSWSPHCQSTPLQGCPISALKWKRGTNQLIQDRWRRQVLRQGAIQGQGSQTGFKTGSRRKTGGTRQGGCRPTDPLSCAKKGVMVKKNVRDASEEHNDLCLRAIFTCLSAQKPQEQAHAQAMGCQKQAAIGGACWLHPVWLHLIPGWPVFAFTRA